MHIGFVGMLFLPGLYPELRLNRLHMEAPSLSGRVTDTDLPEISGLAGSCKTQGLLWMINDSGNANTLFGVSATGQVLGKFNIKDAPNVDWEDLSSFTQGRESYLLIADVGDNMAMLVILLSLHCPGNLK